MPPFFFPSTECTNCAKLRQKIRRRKKKKNQSSQPYYIYKRKKTKMKKNCWPETCWWSDSGAATSSKGLMQNFQDDILWHLRMAEFSKVQTVPREAKGKREMSSVHALILLRTAVFVIFWLPIKGHTKLTIYKLESKMKDPNICCGCLKK